MNSRLFSPLLIFFLAMSFVACRKENVKDAPYQEKAKQDTLFNIENPVTKTYLDFLKLSPYKDGDYTYSYIDDYYKLTTNYRKDNPSPAVVRWKRDSRNIAQKIVYSEDEDFSTSNSFSVLSSAVAAEIYNLLPEKKYYWKVISTIPGGDKMTTGQGWFRTEGRRRFLKVDNVCNVRDLGGIPTEDGKKRIKYGMLFRGGEMNGYHQDYEGNYCRIKASGVSELRFAGVKADLDLRTAEEALNITCSPLGEDVDYFRFENANTYYYDKFWNSPVYLDALQWIIDELKAGKPVLFHCIYGADRTGTLAFIIEALLGIGENQISIDYELTSFSYGLNSAPRRRGPRNELTVYKYRSMVETVLSTAFPGNTLQEKIRSFCINGNGGSPKTVISASDIDWFQTNLLEDL